jgi:hypothetical protein
VDPGVRPVQELAVHPDLFGLLHRPLILSVLDEIARLRTG